MGHSSHFENHCWFFLMLVAITRWWSRLGWCLTVALKLRVQAALCLNLLAFMFQALSHLPSLCLLLTSKTCWGLHLVSPELGHGSLPSSQVMNGTLLELPSFSTRSSLHPFEQHGPAHSGWDRSREWATCTAGQPVPQRWTGLLSSIFQSLQIEVRWIQPSPPAEVQDWLALWAAGEMSLTEDPAIGVMIQNTQEPEASRVRFHPGKSLIQASYLDSKQTLLSSIRLPTYEQGRRWRWDELEFKKAKAACLGEWPSWGPDSGGVTATSFRQPWVEMLSCMTESSTTAHICDPVWTNPGCWKDSCTFPQPRVSEKALFLLKVLKTLQKQTLYSIVPLKIVTR